MKISIITPSYNQAQFIKRTLDSVLIYQDYDNIEHIVIDGCSSDGTLKILKEYKNKYSDKLFYVYEKDLGQSNAINKGFIKSKGDIIGWINSDDYYEDNIFQFVVEFFQSNPDVDMIYGGCNRVDKKGIFIGKFEDDYYFKKCRIKNYKEFNYDTLLNIYSGLIPQPTVFYRRKVFEEVGYLDETYDFTMDYEYWLRIGKKCNIYRVDRVLANFRSHDKTKTRFENRFGFFKEALKTRRNQGGKLVAPFYLPIGLVIIKTIVKMIMIRLKILQ